VCGIANQNYVTNVSGKEVESGKPDELPIIILEDEAVL
jgi:hypothetical protein